MKVALVLATSTGGVGAHVRALAAGLVDAGVEVTVVGPPATEALFGFAALGVTFEPTHGRFDVRTIRRPDVDIVHAHGLRAGTVAAAATAHPRRPLVVTWHNAVLDDDHGRAARRLLAVGERFVARRAEVTLAASADLAARAAHLGARDVRVSPVALPDVAPRRGRDQVRAELGIAVDTRVVLSVARLHPQKALDVLVEASTGWPDTTVVIAGDGPLRPALQMQIDRLGAPVRLLGRRADVADLLAAADVAALPSRWEARSLFAQEAVHAGVPLVATAVGGLPELLGDGAVLVPAGDVAALREAVSTLLADSDAQVALAERGRAQAATWPSAAATTAQVLAVYHELTGAA